MRMNESKKMSIKDRQNQVAQMLREGKVYREMAAKIDCALGTIKNDVDAIVQEWRETVSSTYNEHVIAELTRLLDIDVEATEQWEASKGRKRTKVKRVPLKLDVNGKMIFEETVEVITLLPESKYLDIRTNISNQIRKLLGIDKPVKFAPTDPGGENEFKGVIIVPNLDDGNGEDGNGND